MTIAPVVLVSAMAVSVGSSPAAVESAPPTYEVADGDTVSAIAERFGLQTAAILAANGLDAASLIFPGQVLRLVDAATTAPAPDAAAAPPTPAPVTVGRHVVVAGDTVWAIAHVAGLTVDELLAANALTRESIIYPGQELTLPLAGTIAGSPATASAAEAVAAAVPAAASFAITDEMRANAAVIVRVGRDLGVPDRGLVIALAAAMQESGLRNLDHGDRDSRGLFQQRPSTGWGTADQVADPVHASLAFFGGASNPNPATRGLLDVPGWEQLSLTQAAQAVQLSAFPDAYADWEGAASALLAELG